MEREGRGRHRERGERRRGGITEREGKGGERESVREGKGGE